MNTLPSNTIIVAIVVILVVVAAIAWIFARKMESNRLRRRFGPEYGRAVEQLGGEAKAEAELKRREQRVSRLKLMPLSAADAARFSQSWMNLQGRFIDNPRGVVAEADQLVRELMTKRGYPMGDFERRAADISVDHPGVVATYRAAQIVAARDARGEADTEDLRKAVVYYRTLFDELLGVSQARAAAGLTGQVPAHQ